MGIFDQEQAKMAEEATVRAKSAAQKSGEVSELAANVSQDLLGFLARYPNIEDIDVGLLENEITLTGRSTQRSIRIFCLGSDIFRVSGNDVGNLLHWHGQQQVYIQPRSSADDTGTISRSVMARIVGDWIKELSVGPH
jgi:hypothetical protein